MMTNYLLDDFANNQGYMICCCIVLWFDLDEMEYDRKLRRKWPELKKIRPRITILVP